MDSRFPSVSIKPSIAKDIKGSRLKDEVTEQKEMNPKIFYTFHSVVNLLRLSHGVIEALGVVLTPFLYKKSVRQLVHAKNRKS